MIQVGALCLLLGLFSACAASGGVASSGSVQEAVSNTQQSSSLERGETQLISPEQAKALMDTQENVLVLDVRTPEEYAEGHIANAILIPDYELAERAETELTDPAQPILVYCRSGRRSKSAAHLLTRMGYTSVKDFGGILDWPYDVTLP